MRDLARQQEAFAAALASAARAPAAAPLFHGAPEVVLDRIAIYRGNVVANARKALENAYPIVAKIVGDGFFEALAREYLRRHPSTSGDLNDYGGHLPGFVADFEQTRDLPYLADVARMEWLAHRSHYAADAPPLSLEQLATLLARDPARLTMRLAPACALLESRWPLARLWEIHQDDFTGNFAVDLDAGPDRILVHRPGFRATVTALTAGAYRFLDACAAGSTMAAALAAALIAEPGFDLSAPLRAWAADGVIAGFDDVLKEDA